MIRKCKLPFDTLFWDLPLYFAKRNEKPRKTSLNLFHLADDLGSEIWLFRVSVISKLSY